MGREIKRVPVDFTHEGVWPGFVRTCDNTECEGCPDCDKQEPPEGDAYQVWETVSEGSPVSTAFPSREACVAWLVEHEKCAPAAAAKFIDDGWAPSFISSGFGVFSGVQIAAGEAVHIEWLHTLAGDYSTLPPGTPIRHKESGITGKVNHRFPPSQREYYYVTWDKGLPALVATDPAVDPGAPMQAGCREDGFDVIETVNA